jgi:uncharacterized protein
MADRIVVDTGPVIALARAGALEIVPKLPLEFVCPGEVQDELEEGEARGFPPIRTSWLTVVSLRSPVYGVGETVLGRGEAAVIKLAIEHEILRVCIDDRKGRRAAMAVGLRVTGSLGLLARAKTLGLIPELRPFVQRATKEGIWYEPGLVQQVLLSVGETDE